MPDFSAITRSHVMSAIDEYDRRGRSGFHTRYGYAPARQFFLRYKGRLYDATSLVGVAQRFATGTPAPAGTFAEGHEGAAGVLADLGFDVPAVGAEEQRTLPSAGVPPKQAATRTARAPRAPRAPRTPAKPPVEEKPVQICPHCFMALPATGKCDCQE